MNFIDPEDNLVDFPEKFLSLRDELDFKHEALLEDKEVERRVEIYDGLVEKGANLTPMEFMIFMDRSYVFKYPVLNTDELFELGSIQSRCFAKKLRSPWSGNHVVSQETMDFLSLFFGEYVSLFYNTPNFKSNKKFFFKWHGNIEIVYKFVLVSRRILQKASGRGRIQKKNRAGYYVGGNISSLVAALLSAAVCSEEPE